VPRALPAVLMRAHTPGGNVFDMVYSRKNLHSSDKAKKPYQLVWPVTASFGSLGRQMLPGTVGRDTKLEAQTVRLDSNTTYSSYCSMFRRRLDNNCSMFRRRLDLTYTWYKIQVLDCIGVHVYCETCMDTILHPDLLICGKRQRR
jgi:hypothetical protein